MLAHLVTGRYAMGYEEQSYPLAPNRPGWLRRIIAALLRRKIS